LWSDCASSFAILFGAMWGAQMPLSNETALRLLPEGRPESAFSVEEARRLAELDRQVGPQALLSRVLAWHIFIATTLRSNLPRVADSLTGMAWEKGSFELAVGFVTLAPVQNSDPLISQARQNEDYVFGAALFDYRVGRDGAMRSSMDMGALNDRLRGLPLVWVPVAEMYHAAPNVNLGTSSCWAAYPSGGQQPRHILTAAHNVNWAGPGTRVAFSGGLTGQVARSTLRPVDAALIDPNFGVPVLANQISLEPVPVQTEPYVFDGAKSGVVNGKITLVHVLAGIAHPYSPQRVYLDTAGQPGDSGALVRSRQSGRALSIYTGILSGNGATYIHSQAIAQACGLLGIDLWE
jgi:hypothetical protein